MYDRMHFSENTDTEFLILPSCHSLLNLVVWNTWNFKDCNILSGVALFFGVANIRIILSQKISMYSIIYFNVFRKAIYFDWRSKIFMALKFL